jgi:hypothetical protein
LFYNDTLICKFVQNKIAKFWGRFNSGEQGVLEKIMAHFPPSCNLAPNDFGQWADVCGGKFLFGNKIVRNRQQSEAAP